MTSPLRFFLKVLKQSIVERYQNKPYQSILCTDFCYGVNLEKMDKEEGISLQFQHPSSGSFVNFCVYGSFNIYMSSYLLNIYVEIRYKL